MVSLRTQDRADTRRPAPGIVPSTARPGVVGRLLRGSVLRHRHFRTVWIAALVSSTGSWMEWVGIQWLVARQSLAPEWQAAGYPGPKMMLAILASAHLLPMLFLGLVGGLAADRVNRKRLLLGTQGILMCGAAAVALASYLGLASPWVLTGLMLGLGVTMAFNVPAWQTLAPRLVPRDELTRAITLNGIQFNLARVVGPALGGLLMYLYGPTVLFVLNTVSFLGVLWAIAATPDAPAAPRDGRGARGLIREALAFVFHHRGPRMVFIGMVVFSILTAPLLRLLPLFISEVYGLQERAFGLFLAAMGVGAVVGGLSMKLVPQWYPKHHLIPLSIMAGGLATAAFAVFTNPWVAGACMVVIGATWLLAFNSSMAAMQLLVEDRMRGRVLSVCNTAVFGAMPLGGFLGAWIGDIAAHLAPAWAPSALGFGVQAAVLVMSLALAAAGLIMLVWRTPEVDGLGPGDPGFDRRPGFWNGLTASAHRPVPPPLTDPVTSDSQFPV